MPENNQIFSLEKFERHVHLREHELAARELLSLLNFLDSHYGAWGDIGTRPSNDRTRDRADMHVITRAAAAVSSLFADPDFKINIQGWGSFVFYHRWLTILFGASDFANADHVLHLMKNTDSEQGRMTFDDAALIKFSLLYSGDSNIPLQAEAFWTKNPTFAAGLCMALLSSRLTISGQALEKKEWLLEWLPKKLEEIELHDALLPYIHDVWMHCSYAFGENKHDIKASINRTFRKRLLKNGCEEPQLAEERAIREKPVMVIPLEWFTSKHAMYRCYSTAIRMLRNKFRIIAVATPIVIDDISREIFDDIIEIDRAPVLLQVQTAVEKINQLEPDIIYYPSVGMQLMVVALATLRLAPIQCMGLGHPASSRSDMMDYVISPTSLFKDTSRFSEKLIGVPDDAIPMVLPHGAIRVEPALRTDPDQIRIAVTASVMKLNPVFLRTCAEIANRSDMPIVFYFFVGHGIGVTRHYISNQIDSYLKNAVVFPHSNYDSYIENLNQCDIFINPFPFGNNNGIVDTVRQGLPGICMDGGEPHSHSDTLFFNLLGLPGWTITNSIDNYIDATVRLANNHDERLSLGEKLLTIDPDKLLFDGSPEKFSEAIWEITQNHESLQMNEADLIQLP